MYGPTNNDGKQRAIQSAAESPAFHLRRLNAHSPSTDELGCSKRVESAVGEEESGKDTDSVLDWWLFCLRRDMLPGQQECAVGAGQASHQFGPFPLILFGTLEVFDVP